MSFTKTISVFAALASIFAAGAAGWKLAQDDNQQPNTDVLEQKIVELEEKLQEKKQPQVIPPLIQLPESQERIQVTPSTPVIPPPPPVPPQPTNP